MFGGVKRGSGGVIGSRANSQRLVWGVREWLGKGVVGGVREWSLLQVTGTF